MKVKNIFAGCVLLGLMSHVYAQDFVLQNDMTIPVYVATATIQPASGAVASGSMQGWQKIESNGLIKINTPYVFVRDAKNVWQWTGNSESKYGGCVSSAIGDFSSNWSIDTTDPSHITCQQGTTSIPLLDLSKSSVYSFREEDATLKPNVKVTALSLLLPMMQGHVSAYQSNLKSDFDNVSIALDRF